jgi:hypothetical protein
VPIRDDTFEFDMDEETQFLPIGYTETRSGLTVPLGQASDIFSGGEGSVVIDSNSEVTGWGFLERRQEKRTSTKYTRLDGIDAGAADIDYVSDWNLPKRLGMDWEYPFYFSVFGYTNDWNDGVPSVPVGEEEEHYWYWEENIYVEGQHFTFKTGTLIGESPEVGPGDDPPEEDYYWHDPWPIKPRYYKDGDRVFFIASLVRNLYYYLNQNPITEYYVVDSANAEQFSAQFNYSNYINGNTGGLIGSYNYYLHAIPDVIINNQEVYGKGNFRLFRWREKTVEEQEISYGSI